MDGDVSCTNAEWAVEKTVLYCFRCRATVTRSII